MKTINNAIDLLGPKGVVLQTWQFGYYVYLGYRRKGKFIGNIRVTTMYDKESALREAREKVRSKNPHYGVDPSSAILIKEETINFEDE